MNGAGPHPAPLRPSTPVLHPANPCDVAVVREPGSVRLLQDILRIVFAGLILAAVGAAAVLPPPVQPPALDTFGRVLAALAAELFTLMVLRELVRRPEPGWFRITVNRDYVRWLLSSTLTEVAWHPLLRLPFWYLHATRVLYLKALGADLAWSASFHAQLVIRDPALLRIGAGAQLEPGVILEAGLHGAGRVRVGAISVGPGCLVGAHALVLPGASLGDDVRVEPATVIGEDVRVGVGSTIGEGARLERGVDLGSYVTVGTGAILSEGVRVGDRARIAPGALVQPDTQIKEREVWAGVPARPVNPWSAAEETDRIRPMSESSDRG